MNKVYLFVLIYISGISLFAQGSPSDKLFEKMALKKGVTMLSFSKQMLDAVNLNFDDDETGSENNITGDLNEVKLIIYSAPDDDAAIDFRKETLKYLPKSKYKEVDADDYDGDDEDVDVMVLRSGRKIKECHIIFQGEENGVLLSFFGNFKIEDVKELADKVDNYK